MAKNENVNHPAHYQKEGRKECIEEMLEKFGVEAVKHFCLLNAYKYEYRHELKGGNEDIEKARWYMNKFHELGGDVV
jgi:ABC-type oligopeptide transport system ATPase subunit